MWGLHERWKATDKVHIRFCKKILRMSRSTAKRVAGLELRYESGRGKAMCVIVKWWLCLLDVHVDGKYSVRNYYERQIMHLNADSLAGKLNE